MRSLKNYLVNFLMGKFFCFVVVVFYLKLSEPRDCLFCRFKSLYDGLLELRTRNSPTGCEILILKEVS